MNRTKTIYFLSAIVCIIGCYALSLSYSLFVDTQEKEIVNAVVPRLSYSLENDTFDIKATSGELIKLKVINSGTADMKYGIKVDEDTLSGATVQLVEKEGNDIVGELAASTTPGETSETEVWLYVTNSTETDITGLTFILEAKYNTLNFDADTFKTNSNIDCVNKNNNLNVLILVNAKSTKTADYDKTMYVDPGLQNGETYSIPAEEISRKEERLLLETEDDYTEITGKNSYYFRGNVKDNYLNYAGMCWRIVRIEGDGSIKIILYSQQECSAGMSADYNLGAYAYGYKKLNNMTIADFEHGMNERLQSWKTSKDLDEKFLKTDEVWCLGDNSKAYGYSNSDTPYQKLIDEPNILISNRTPFYYKKYIDITGKNENAHVTLKCEGNPFIGVIGALTVDEVIFAGGIVDTSNSAYYLSAGGGNWWTLSVSYFNGNTDRALYFGSGGGIYSMSVDVKYLTHATTGDRTNYGVRPVVTLNANLRLESGNGTIEEPYVVILPS